MRISFDLGLVVSLMVSVNVWSQEVKVDKRINDVTWMDSGHKEVKSIENKTCFSGVSQKEMRYAVLAREFSGNAGVWSRSNSGIKRVTARSVPVHCDGKASSINSSNLYLEDFQPLGGLTASATPRFNINVGLEGCNKNGNTETTAFYNQIRQPTHNPKKLPYIIGDMTWTFTDEVVGGVSKVCVNEKLVGLNGGPVVLNGFSKLGISDEKIMNFGHGATVDFTVAGPVLKTIKDLKAHPEKLSSWSDPCDCSWASKDGSGPKAQH